ncbi:hypothetical protein Snoj_12780 [Streptomyces nojiriensis]|uniref:Uncharacterized protein n=1 Tax=Streptomyces nojiriensis TaxID=66374 RepID=A0ABQ3SGV5_9ACTN|nr:hypothetical protein [Streptomyces nojiriensis]QTI48992.1 hypothetical protein JYK04_06860 [Streptomyces nojiriensis]GGS08644.1 hypothetical protein GCM10010205_42600 [Streptomyces nojiriensis]GHI67360.1 hypothetical protein Snoj_12780 [Streptomyces nojiriensis]
MTEMYEYQPHRLLRKRVRDIASGIEGQLMAVITEGVNDIAYIRKSDGREFTTAAANVQAAGQ